MSERAAKSALWAWIASGWSALRELRRTRARGAQRLFDRLGRDVEVVGVGVVERGAHVLPVVGERRGDLLLRRDQDERVVGRELEERVEAVDRQQLRHVGPVVFVLERGDLGQLAVLGRELGRRRDLDRVGLAERALGERREPAQRVDLDVEQVDAHRLVLGRRVDVEDAAADRELAAVVDLVDALVAARDELRGDLVEVEQVALAQPERRRAQRRVGDLLAQRDGADDDDRRLVGRVTGRQQRVERGDAQADEVRRRREVRLVGDAAARVESGPGAAPATRAGRRPGRAPGGRRRRRRAPGGRWRLGQRGEHVRPQRQRHERLAAIGDERGAGRGRQ